MAKITYREYDGTEHAVEVDNGLSVMQGAVRNGIPGIDGDCGGECACGTCHVHLDAHWLHKTGERTSMEESMLEFADGADESSRLSCQITVSDEIAGLVVQLPEAQH
jgi:ferredoxin, 2Fe-2S